ncbi:MAG: septum formation initiator family protein [Deltaproteobacteria bacterium]|nr:septum formation initiator family protein [Deltaproteobacteria bacterium]
MARWRWLLPLGLILGSVIAVPAMILGEEGLPRYRRMRYELDDARAANRKLRREIETLREEIHDLRKDPRAIERIARDELGMIKPDELLFQF